MKFFTKFYSDPHFGHRNISKYADRPFKNVDEMNTALIDNYNAIVKSTDCCLWLGDTFFTTQEEASVILGLLNGEKVLIKGNHDRHSSRWYLDIGFSLVFQGFIDIKIGDRKARAGHYPYVSALKTLTKHDDIAKLLKYKERYAIRKKDEILIHGHTHTKVQVVQNAINVCVDAWGYSPVTLEQIKKLVQEMY